MRKLHRSNVEEKIAANAVKRLDCVSALKNIYINGLQSPPLSFCSDLELKRRWRDDFDEEIEIVHSF